MIRRGTIPQELEDPEDCLVGESEGDLFEPESLDEDFRKITIEEEQGFKGDLLRLPKEIRNILAGGVAGMSAKSVVAPVDRIKILYQVSSAKFHLRDISQVARNIINSEGLGALWKGNTATMVRVFPYRSVMLRIVCKGLAAKSSHMNRFVVANQKWSSIHGI